ncbi:hypothetical protein [Mesorhizobium sp. L103C120A0]|uniref:hypothetical protein n=1 Tax=Mesorhizobium sp. L103C120A0 TaxID=1287086 RepID=UPI001FD9EC07|nr:hypothetical protein [Mesorhizobium sp. L103C120A0]
MKAIGREVRLRIEFGLAAGGDDDPGTFFGEEFCGGAPDAGTGAGDDRYFIGEYEHFLTSFHGTRCAGNRDVDRSSGRC